MRVPIDHIDEYFLKRFIYDNWDEILLMIENSMEDWGELGKQIINELKKYDLSLISLEKKEDKEDDEE